MRPRGEAPTFAAPWEARAFALAVALRDAGHLAWPAFAERLATRLAEEPEHPYYERWLAALEDLTAPAR